MNKRGFSLVELLAVISILAIIAFIVSVPITKNIKEGNEKACSSQFNTIIEAAKLWGNENVELLPNNINGKDKVTVGTLKKEGFLSNDLKNPVTDEEIPNDLDIFIEKVGNKRWKYTIDEEVVDNYCKNIPIDDDDKVDLPTYSVNPSGDVWARSKRVTITYPDRKENYIYQYSVDGLDNWITVSSGTTVNLEFIKDSNVTARIYDGEKYHTASTLTVTKIDRMSPINVSVTKASSTTKSITVKANGIDGESGIGKYEFSKDNGATWISNGTNNIYTFTNLKTGSYNVKVRITDKVGNATTSETVSMSTNTIILPTYTVEPSGDVWARSKTVTIHYPENTGGYTYQYSINGGSSWTTVSGTTATYTFNANGNIIARIYDGTNYYNGSTLSVTKIDTTPPTNVSVVKTNSTSNSITVIGNGIDNESGIQKYEFSKDNGSSWINNNGSNTYTFTGLSSGTYYIKVRITDKVGNVTTSNAISVSTEEIQLPTYTVEPSGDVWARRKTVTIHYPENTGGYTYQYSINGGSSWITVTGTTATYTFNANGNIIARIYDGSNYYNGSTLSVTKIDNVPPQSVYATEVSTTENSITIRANGMDEESGIQKYEFSKDNGSSWINNNGNDTYTFTGLSPGTYYIKVRVTDMVGNSSASSVKIVEVKEKEDLSKPGIEVYYNPETGKECNDYVESNSLNEHKTGCMKWYTFGDNGSTTVVNLLLDHNTTYRTRWSSTSYNDTNGDTARAKLAEDTRTWISGIDARMPTRNDILWITGSEQNFDIKFSWVLGYMANCSIKSCAVEDNNTEGYWTSTPYPSTMSAYSVRIHTGGLGNGIIRNEVDNDNLGIRPLITVPKSTFSKYN